jgi:hypothetical protein
MISNSEHQLIRHVGVQQCRASSKSRKEEMESMSEKPAFPAIQIATILARLEAINNSQPIPFIMIFAGCSPWWI